MCQDLSPLCRVLPGNVRGHEIDDGLKKFGNCFVIQGEFMSKTTLGEVLKDLEHSEQITIGDSRSADSRNQTKEKAGGTLHFPPGKTEKHITDVRRDDYLVTYSNEDSVFRLPGFSKCMVLRTYTCS
jgi:hypothetical protein